VLFIVIGVVIGTQQKCCRSQHELCGIADYSGAAKQDMRIGYCWEPSHGTPA
jgi:hypothetical protein